MANNFGEIYMREGEPVNGERPVILDITIDGKKFTGKKNERKSNDNHPDYRIFDAAGADVGAAWKGQTKQNNTKLSMKITGFEKSLTAVMTKDPKEGEPDLVVMPL